MIRVCFWALIFAAGMATLFNAPWLATPSFIAFLVLYITGRVTGSTGPLKCPFCRKRVKLGAHVCHHCGRQTLAGAR